MSRFSRNAFTLMELLVVIAIIALLIGLLLPATRRVREASERAHCQNNLKQLALSMHNYSSNSGGTLPTGCVGPRTIPEKRLSWMVALLPYLEQETLHEQFNLEKGYAENLSTSQTAIRTYLCPWTKKVTKGGAVSHYVAMAGLGPNAATRSAGAKGNGFMGYDRETSFKMIEDGTSNTIALMETRTQLGPWARGGPCTLRAFDPKVVPRLHGEKRLFSSDPEGVNVGIADGSVRFVSPSFDPKKLAAAITIAGGESDSLD